jgi:hypothetical protein
MNTQLVMNYGMLGEFPGPAVNPKYINVDENYDSAERFAVFYKDALPGNRGLVVSQNWHGEGRPQTSLYHETYFNSINHINRLAVRGLESAFAATGVHTKVVELPEIDNQPPSTLAAISFLDTDTFSHLANHVLRFGLSDCQARLVTDDERELMSFSARMRVEDMKAECIRLCSAILIDPMFQFHDWAVHGLAWTILGRIPEITSDLSKQASEILDRSPPRAGMSNYDDDDITELSGRLDEAISPRVLLEVAAGNMPTGWKNLWQGELSPNAASELLRRQLGIMAVTKFVFPEPRNYLI